MQMLKMVFQSVPVALFSLFVLALWWNDGQVEVSPGQQMLGWEIRGKEIVVEVERAVACECGKYDGDAREVCIQIIWDEIIAGLK